MWTFPPLVSRGFPRTIASLAVALFVVAAWLARDNFKLTRAAEGEVVKLTKYTYADFARIPGGHRRGDFVKKTASQATVEFDPAEGGGGASWRERGR